MRYGKEKRERAKALVIAVVLVTFGAITNWCMVNQSLDRPNPYQELYDQLLKPSVQIRAGYSTGSGVVISSTSQATYILSAAHVVGDESTVDVTFYFYHGDTEIKAHVVATDTAKDLALLRTYTYKPYPYVAKLALSTYRPYIFTPIWVIGCALGYPPRPTNGEVTAINSHWEINAPIWPGNSGGGVFLKDTNELIGIAVLVKVYRGQLVSTMGSIVTLQEIYEFLEEGKVVYE